MKYLKYPILVCIACLFIIHCQSIESTSGTQVSTSDELHEAILNAEPGASIIMANGIWNDVQIKFYGEGTEEKPIVLRAETPGEVIMQGASDLKLGGSYLVVNGLYFKNGASPSRSVIQYYLNEDTLAFHSQVTQCVIEDFNKSQKNKVDLWVAFKGRHNTLDHCYLAGKSNKGPTIRIDIKGNESIKNYHQITNNHFGPRPPKGGPSAETIQIGNSSTSMSPSYTMVANNLFDRCNGEVEVISSKTNFNEFRNNVFYKSEGSLVTRHGNYCIVDGNYFIGDEKSSNYGGVRLIGTGHWVTNNYFYNLRGEIFRAPLAVMNGIRKSPLNRYIQVTDVVIAHNTYVNCKSPWQFGVGSNVDQKEVLPASEIRSEKPIRTLVANNVIYNTKGDAMPIFRHDEIGGIDFRSNVINNQNVDFEGVEGLKEMDFAVKDLGDDIFLPTNAFSDIEIHKGFQFEDIATDLFGNARKDKNTLGAGISSGGTFDIMDNTKYGPSWYNPKSSKSKSKHESHMAETTEELLAALGKAKDGDVIMLTAEQYKVNAPLKINKKLLVQSTSNSVISYTGKNGAPAFEMHPKGDLHLIGISLQGSGSNYAFASLQGNMSSLYNLKVEACNISNFDALLKAYKYSFSEFITFNSTVIKNCNNGLELSSEDDDRGEYNAENISITDCQFDGVKNNVINYYRGGYDESTVGGTLIVKGSTFKNCGAAEKSGILINTYGIINVDLTSNTFQNNSVKYMARLWGAKNNSETSNTFKNSGKIITEQNLPLKLMY